MVTEKLVHRIKRVLSAHQQHNCYHHVSDDNHEETTIQNFKESDPQSSCDLHNLRGRPLYTVCHKIPRQSLFSRSNSGINLKGFLNLICIVVIAQNARLVIENLLKYGVRTRLLTPSSIDDLINNWPVLLSLIGININLSLAFCLERLFYALISSNYYRFFNPLPLVLVWGNAGLVLLFPYCTLKLHHVDPVSGTLLLGFSITWFLKLVSFHHVLADARDVLLNDCPNHLTDQTDIKRHLETLTFTQYYSFLMMPTLCYQFHYPRTRHIRWTILLRHMSQMLVCLILIRIVVEQYILVILQNTFISPETLGKMSVLRILLHLSERILNLSIPNLCVWLLMFFIIFHHWLNILAEITFFADREFYGDWWNSSSFDEYWRKWNCPIHNFFSRHVHKPLLRRGVTRLASGNIIFIISALAHEYMVVVPLRLGWTGLVFTGFIAQIPLIHITSKPFFKRYPTLGNILFWFIFCFSGQPLVILFYYYLWGVQHGKVEHVNVTRIQDIRLI